MNQVPPYAWSGLSAVLGVFIGWFVHKRIIASRLGNARNERDRLIEVVQ